MHKVCTTSAARGEKKAYTYRLEYFLNYLHNFFKIAGGAFHFVAYYF